MRRFYPQHEKKRRERNRGAFCRYADVEDLKIGMSEFHAREFILEARNQACGQMKTKTVESSCPR